MKRKKRRILAFIVAVAIMMTSVPVYAAGYSRGVKEVLHYTNVLREAAGVEALSVYPALQTAAAVRQQELSSLFSHTRPNGTGCDTVLNEHGIGYQSMGENIAQGYRSAIDVVTGWRDSEGHYKNIVNTGFSHVGIGDGTTDAKNSWVQLFTGSCTPTALSAESKTTLLLEKGTKINDYLIGLNVTCAHGTGWVSVLDSMCSAYDSNNTAGVQNITVTYKGLTTTVPVKFCEPMNFTDVSEGDWYYNYVEYIYLNGIMTGLTSTKFGPNDLLSRGQFATIIYRLQGTPGYTPTKTFPDVADGTYYKDAILWANTTGIITGYTNGYFGPEDNITREQMAVMMYRYAIGLGLDISQRADYSAYSDASQVSDFAREAMGWVIQKGIMNGKTTTTLAPQDNATRAECATVIQRFINIAIG